MSFKTIVKRKRKLLLEDEPQKENPLPDTRMSDDVPRKKVKWINRQRVLVFAARGTTQRDRYLMKDIKTLMPHSRDENKMKRKEDLSVINELCDMKNCNKSVFFEGRKKKDLYMWVSNVPKGPSAKFLIESVFTMGELKLTGNCLKGSRPLLSFDDNFKSQPHYALLKELFIQVFGVPNYHPKSQPFVDRVITFSIMDNRIWYRNYQILKEDGALAEIGPRFVMNPIKIFNGSFGGEGLWENPHYITPSLHRRQVAMAAGQKYIRRQDQKTTYINKEPKMSYSTRPEDEIFEGETYETAASLVGVQLSEKPKTKPLSFKKKKRGGQKMKKKTVKNS